MTDAACEDCHMPKTNRNANRISHGMKPMLPGKAEEWQAAAGYNGEDSCSGCHPSRTRGQLQAKIDDWQEDRTAQAWPRPLRRSCPQASTRSGYSLTVPTKAGYTLVGRATWNYKAFVNDASTGVHNPEYIQAGLEKAVMMAKSVGGKYRYISAKTPVRKGARSHIAGRIVNGDGTSAAGAKVTLKRGSKVLGTTMTDAKGHFAFTFKVTKTYKNYRVKWSRSGSGRTILNSKRITIRAR